MESLFPVTLWPSVPLSAVAVTQEPLIVGDDGSLRWRGPRPDRALSELPEEWVLRGLADCDLDDDQAVADLLRTSGVIARPYFDPASVPADRRDRLAPSGPDAKYGWWQNRGDGRLEDARWWLKTARALARIWATASSGQESLGVWANEGFVGLSFNARRQPEVDDHWMQFVLALNLGLDAFQAHAGYAATVGSATVQFGVPRVDLYSAACRQVFNFVVRDEHPRACQNETCDRTFVRQLGGANHGQYRTKGNLKYCTPQCNHQQRSREHRRRQKSA